MPGQWVPGDELDAGQRPGLYSRFSSQATVAVTGGVTGVVGVVANTIEGSFGVVGLDTLDEFQEEYGDTVNNTYRAVRNVFQGGARRVLFSRLDRESSVTVEGSSSEDSIELTSKNIDEDTLVALIGITASKVTLSLTNNGVAVPGQTWTTTADNSTVSVVVAGVTSVIGTAEELVNLINNDSEALLEAELVSGANVSANANMFVDTDTFTFVDDGDFNYTSAINALAAEDFSILFINLSPFNPLWTNIESQLDSLRDNDGKYIRWVTGSRSRSGKAQAIADGALDNDGIDFVHPGAVINGVTYQGFQLAARIAGMQASLPLADSITYRPLVGATDVTIRYSTEDVKDLIEAGVMPIVYDGRAVKVERGNNTLVTTTTDRPISFKKVKVVRILDAINNALNMSIADQVIGKIANNKTGRIIVLGAIRRFLRSLVSQGVINGNFVVQEDPNNPPTLDRLFVVIGVQPVDSIEFVYTTIQVF